MQRIKEIFDKYFLVFLICLGLLNSLTYSFGVFENFQIGGNVFRIIIVLIFTLVACFKLFLDKFEPSLIFIIFCILYFLSNIIISFISPHIFNVKVDASVHLYGIIQLFVNILCIFLGLLLLEDKNQNTRLSLLIIIVFCCFLCLYALCFQFKDIVNTFKVASDECKTCGVNADVKSIYNSKTVFGFMLLLGFLSSIYLSLKERKYYFFISSFIILVFIFLSRAKTSILTILILSIIIIAYKHKAIISFSRRHLLPIILSGLVLSVIVVLIILKIGPFFSALNLFISKTLLEDGMTVMRDRFYRWGTTIKSLSYNWSILIFGIGHRTSDVILKSTNGFAATDNAYINLIASGGFLLLFIYLFWIFIITKRLLKHKNYYSVILIILLVINGLFETNYMLGLSYSQLLPFTMIFLSRNNQKNAYCSL